MEAKPAADREVEVVLRVPVADSGADGSEHLSAMKRLSELVVVAEPDGSRVVTVDELQRLGKLTRSVMKDCRLVDALAHVKRSLGSQGLVSAIYITAWFCRALMSALGGLASVAGLVATSSSRSCNPRMPGHPSSGSIACLFGCLGWGGAGSCVTLDHRTTQTRSQHDVAGRWGGP